LDPLLQLNWRRTQFFNNAKEATITAFVTGSSGGTLPVTLNVAAKTENEILKRPEVESA